MSPSAAPIGLPRWHPAFWISTWFFSGLMPKAPGTWGSLAALPFAWALSALGGTGTLAAAVVVVSLVGWAAAEIYVRRTGGDDPGEVVIDEVAGQWLTLCAVPCHPLWYLAGFALFRLFDITKPFPVGWADRTLPGGLGIMTDDLLAGLYGAAILTAARLLIGG